MPEDFAATVLDHMEPPSDLRHAALVVEQHAGAVCLTTRDPAQPARVEPTEATS